MTTALPTRYAATAAFAFLCVACKYLLFPRLFRKKTLAFENAQKSASESRTTMTEMIIPSISDTRGFAYGGKILSWIDICAGMAAKRHAVNPCVTRTVDAVHFIAPIKVGDLVILHAAVNRSWKTSMEVGVRVQTEDMLTGEKKYCCHAYLTFVALTPNSSSPTQVQTLVPETPTEKARHVAAEARRQARFARSEFALGGMPIPSISIKSPETYNGDGEATRGFVELSSASAHERAHSGPNQSSNRTNRPDFQTISETYAEVVELVLPQHANSLGITFGGQIMAWMEQCAITSAARHARSYLLTASLDSLNFRHPTHVGDIIIIKSFLTAAWKSSMEIYITVESENVTTGIRNFTNDAYATIVAVDQDNHPIPVPSLLPPTTPTERAAAAGVDERRHRRLTEMDALRKGSAAEWQSKHQV